MNSTHYLKYLAGFAPPITQTSEAERQTLREFATGKKRLAEVGVFHGVNTRSFREVMAGDAVLIAIDPFQRSFFGIRGYGWARRIAHREVSKSSNGKVIWIEDAGKNTPSRVEVSALLPVDFIFVDGDHSWEGLRGDWESWSAHVSLNGIVALHDSLDRGGAGSEKFTSEVILHDPRYEKVRVVDSLTVLRRVE